MSCDACDRAATNALTALFNVGCFECTTRALAGGPTFFESAQADAITPAYRGSLQAMFGAEWKEAHQAVRKWHERITEAKKKGTT
ncbi:MAG: hypothetical protein ABI433_17690 [Burkholderiaceae bacterium]